MIREIPPPRESGGSGKESPYQAIREQLGRPPDCERLRGDGPAHKEIARQKVSEDAGQGHAFTEHRAGTEQLRQRALDGTKARKPEAGPNLDQIPKHATGFRSDEAVMAAAAVAWSAPETTRQRLDAERRFNAGRADGMSEQQLARLTRQITINHFGPAERALGSNWRAHVEGYTNESGQLKESQFSNNTKILTVWRMSRDGQWYLQTCFPRP